MTVLARPSRNAVRINKEHTKEFIESFNRSVISAEHLEECARISRMFKRNGVPKE